VGHFLCARQLCTDPSPLLCEKPAYYHTRASVTDGRDPPVSSFARRIATFSPATMNRRVGCGALWCPIAATRLCLPSSTLRRLNFGADHSTTKSSPLSCVARLGSDAPSTSPPLAAKGQCQACVPSTRGHHISCSLHRLCLRVYALLIGHGRALAAKAEPSCPSHPPSTHTAIKGTFPIHFVYTTGFLSVGMSPPHFPHSLSAAANVDSPPHCLSLPLCRSWGSLITLYCFPSPRSCTFDAGAPPHHRCTSEIRFDATPFLSPLSSLPTLSCQCAIT
jgi:hypothetical protein